MGALDRGRTMIPEWAWALGLYCAPLIVAGLRNHRSFGGIVVVNLLLGWTIIGWIIALAWACSYAGPPQRVARRRPRQ